MRRFGFVALSAIAYVWLALWAVSVIGACTMNALQGGDALAFIGRTQEFFSPFNVVNWIAIVLAGAPGFAAMTLREKLR